MRPLSDTAASMVKLLQRRRGFLERLVGDERDDIAALDRIATQPEAALVPWLTHVAFEEWGARGSAARRALSACVSVANPSELLELDEQCRRQWWYQGDAGARTGAGIVRASSVGIAELPTRAIGALSFHPSGRVRERAVKRLAATSGGLELPFLLIRLNDWVDVIARRAEEAVRARLLPAYAEEFVDQLPIVLRLESRKRRQHGTLIHAVVAMLLEPANARALQRGLGSADRRTRRMLFRAVLAARSGDGALIERALADDDTVIRVDAARRARRELAPAALERVVPQLLGDPFPAVRSEGVAAAAERAMSDADSVLFGALVDRSRMVRETARFCLRRYRRFEDFASVYRERITEASLGSSSTRALTSAIIGLGETGRAEDASVLLPFLEDDRPSVRASGARALAMLDIERWLGRLVGMLSDPSAVVTRRVRTAIEPRIGSVDPDSLRRQIVETSFTHGRLNALRLAERLGKWEAIQLLLESMHDRDAVVRSAVLDGMRRWLANRNASFAQPTRAQLASLRSVLDSHRAALEPGVFAELDSIVRFWDRTETRQHQS